MLENGRMLRYFPGEKKLAAPTALSKRYLPKAMFLSVNARPRAEYGFDGKILIMRCCKEEPRTRNRAAKGAHPGYKVGDTYKKDFTINAERYRKLVREKVLPEMRARMWWFHESARYVVRGGVRVKAKRGQAGSLPCPEAGEDLWLQQDGASPHTHHSNASQWKAMAGNPDNDRRPDGFMIRVTTQPARSPARSSDAMTPVPLLRSHLSALLSSDSTDLLSLLRHRI